jgi:hypothetical protein
MPLDFSRILLSQLAPVLLDCALIGLPGRLVKALLRGLLGQLELELLISVPDLLQSLPELGIGTLCYRHGIICQAGIHLGQNITYPILILHFNPPLAQKLH